jgi:hypothetical protein
MNILNHPTNDQLSLTYVPLHNRVTMSVLENILVVGQLMASCSVAWYSVSKMFKKVEKKPAVFVLIFFIYLPESQI